MINKFLIFALCIPAACFSTNNCEVEKYRLSQELYEYRYYVQFLESSMNSAIIDLKEARNLLNQMYFHDPFNETYADILNLINEAENSLTISPSKLIQ